MDRFAIAVVLAAVLGSGSSCKKTRKRFPPPQPLVPWRCNETGAPSVEIANLRRRETGKPPRLWEYLLDLRVRNGEMPPKGAPAPGLFQQSLMWLDEEGKPVRYRSLYTTGYTEAWRFPAPPPPRTGGPPPPAPGNR